MDAANELLQGHDSRPTRSGGPILLPAYVEIAVAVGETEEARTACRELERIGAGFQSGMLGAMVARAHGAVALAAGDAEAAAAAAGGLAGLGGAGRPSTTPRARARRARVPGGDDDAGAVELETARAHVRAAGG